MATFNLKERNECPDCGAEVERKGKCVLCRECGFEACGV